MCVAKCMAGGINKSIWATSTLRDAGLAYRVVRDRFLFWLEVYVLVAGSLFPRVKSRILNTSHKVA